MPIAGEMARFLNAELEGDASARIEGLASPEDARPRDLIYVESERHLARAQSSQAVCVLLPRGLSLSGKIVLRVENPKLAFAKAAEMLIPRQPASRGVHPTALLAASARLAPDVSVGPFTVIEDEVEIRAGVEVGAHCVVGRNTVIGEGTRLYPRVVVYAGSVLGRNVVVHAGCVIGSDGFGYVFGDGRHWKFPQIGRVEIGDEVEIGANTTIDRGSLGVTRIGAGCKLDNLVHVAHNVVIGEQTVIAAQTGISGSTQIGPHVLMGGQVGIADRCRIGERAVLGAQAGVPTGKAIPAGQTVWGTPARPLERFKQQYACLARLPNLLARLEHRLKEPSEN
jgi:UDP-3-O-[3-hydroxymyristoyl] glucosamine N-acyltransferase